MVDTRRAAAPADARGDVDGQRNNGRIRVIEWRTLIVRPRRRLGMRAFVITTFALAVALAPAAAFAQATTSTAAQAPAAPAAPKPPTVAFTTPQGMLLVSIKPDKTAVFEEMMTKLKAGVAKSADETLKKQFAGLKVYKSADLS